MKAILFDMDGVLIDSEIYYLNGTQKWLKDLGYDVSLKDISRIVGTNMKRTYEILCELTNNEYSFDDVKRINEKYFNENPIPYEKQKITGSDSLLSFLKSKNIKMALCSSSPLNIIEEVLKRCDFEKYFDFIISGDILEHSKPDPEIYLRAKDYFNLDAKDCIVIEDSNMGIQAGIRAGMQVIALEDTRFHQDQSIATYKFKSMAEIEKFLAGLI